MTDDQIRTIMLAAGFTIKDGLTDLEPYVYAAARAIEAAAVDAERSKFIKQLSDITRPRTRTHDSNKTSDEILNQLAAANAAITARALQTEELTRAFEDWLVIHRERHPQHHSDPHD